MKVASITFHNADNYGSLLQSYALNKYLYNQGHVAEVIDFRPPCQEKLYRIFTAYPCSLMDVIRNLYSLFQYSNLKKRKIKFQKFQHEKIVLSPSVYTSENALVELNKRYDAVICGSDQIWNPNCADFSRAYLLSFISNKDICIAYAPSIGETILSEQQKQMFQENVVDFHRISLREKQAASQMAEVLQRPVEHVPDPVLLLESREWEKIASPRLIDQEYIFCYFIGNPLGMRDFAREIRRKTGMPLVVVQQNLRELLYYNKKMYFAGPEDFLSLIKHSQYICTDSFHAVMFSLMFQKNFWAFRKSENSMHGRIDSILQMVNLQHRLISQDALPLRPLECIDFKDVSERLDQFRKVGQHFLDEALYAIDSNT